MRLALPSLLSRPLAQRLFHNANISSSYLVSAHHFQHRCLRGSLQGRRNGSRSERPDDDRDNNINEANDEPTQTITRLSRGEETTWQWLETDTSKGVKADGTVKQHGLHALQTTESSSITDDRASRRKKDWKNRLSRFEQYQLESDLSTPQSPSHQNLLVNDEMYANDSSLWLELIRFRKRHYGAQGAQALFKEIFRRNMSLSTSSPVGRELWELMIMAGYQDSEFLLNAISYALLLKQNTGNVWSELYYIILAPALKIDPILAYDMHNRLKDSFPPNVDDFRRLFRLCASQDNVDDFERLYRDYPLPGMYATVIPHLCRLQRYRDAVKWHNLLFTFKDLPSVFADIHPLLTYVVQRGDSRQLEQLVTDLKQAHGAATSMPNAAEKFVRKHNAMGREIFNRHMGEVHGVTPKHLSDGFCARLLATKLFSIDTVISGLHMMSVDKIGPLALREIAARDDSDTTAICRHLDALKDKGVTLDTSIFSTLMQKLASRGDKALLRSLTECDLHPDTFEDTNLQERLLAQYYDRDDRLQFERTLAAISVGCKEQDLLKWRLNLTLRCLITLGKQEAAISMMQTMIHKNVPVTAKSSRYLRVCLLSKRERGHTAATTQELSMIINATISTLRSGGYVPIVAWKELLRRLGMAGRLEEFESLALWVVDFYTGPQAPKSLPVKTMLKRDVKAGNSLNTNPQAFLKTLFTIAGQHAIVAWGFQEQAKAPPQSRGIQSGLASHTEQRPLWMWGLVLLHRMQARGVPIHKSTVARICTHRLMTLFGDGVSNRRINRRSSFLNRRAVDFYIREMKGLWGEDLFFPEQEASLIDKLK